MTLADHHRELLSASAISPEVIEARGYFTATRKSELAALGFGRAAQRVPTLVLPQWSVLGECSHHVVRPDDPRLRDDRPVKYETPAGAAQCLDVPPAAHKMLDDPAVPLVITEG